MAYYYITAVVIGWLFIAGWTANRSTHSKQTLQTNSAHRSIPSTHAITNTSTPSPSNSSRHTSPSRTRSASSPNKGRQLSPSPRKSTSLSGKGRDSSSPRTGKQTGSKGSPPSPSKGKSTSTSNRTTATVSPCRKGRSLSPRKSSSATSFSSKVRLNHCC